MPPNTYLQEYLGHWNEGRKTPAGYGHCGARRAGFRYHIYSGGNGSRRGSCRRSTCRRRRGPRSSCRRRRGCRCRPGCCRRGWRGRSIRSQRSSRKECGRSFWCRRRPGFLRNDSSSWCGRGNHDRHGYGYVFLSREAIPYPVSCRRNYGNQYHTKQEVTSCRSCAGRDLRWIYPSSAIGAKDNVGGDDVLTVWTVHSGAGPFRSALYRTCCSI
jgi:hypothetical protein